MIRNFAEHWADQRTFLILYFADPGIAAIAFGFVVEKFNLFIRILANTAATEIGRTIRMERLFVGPLGHYEGLVLSSGRGHRLDCRRRLASFVGTARLY